MFTEGIRGNSYVYPLYLNYGNLLYQLYVDNHNPKTLDSAIKNYESAIELNKNEESLYRSILPPLSDKKDQKEFDHYSRKLIEMDESNYVNYFNIGLLNKQKNNFIKANSFFQQAIDRCLDSNIRKQINHYLPNFASHITYTRFSFKKTVTLNSIFMYSENGGVLIKIQLLSPLPIHHL